MNVVAVIPAYNPDHRLALLVKALRDRGLSRIVVVDDGSRASCKEIFRSLESACTVLHHAVNLGKGRALKTAFNHCALRYPSVAGVVTVDADGQHDPEDVLRVARALESQPHRLVLGARRFTGNVPLRSLLGNLVTRYVFLFLAGRRITDTQSGLRGVPRELLGPLTALEGERYEYEMNMLVFSKRRNLVIEEVPIRTIYLDDNRSSHFNPFLDSFVIYFLLLRFASSSLLSSVVDTILFYILVKFSISVKMSVFWARVVSSLLNFAMNREYVFRSDRSVFLSIFYYYLLVVFIGILSYFSIVFLFKNFGMNLVLAKITSETALFLVSFLVQRDLIFFKKR